MTPILFDFACKSGFTLCKEESALREMLEQFAKFIIEHEAAKQHDNDSVGSASAWFALVMNAAAELEDASHCLRDEDAKRVAISGAKHYRDAANALYTTPPAAQRQWVGLTDEDYNTNMFSITSLGACDIATIKSIAKDVEAKLKEKNT